jgi:uncharacterized damage-inducible protein DinB
MSIGQSLLPEFDTEMANTRKMLERVPDGKFDYKPHEKSMALGRLAAHTAEMASWGTMTLTTERLDMTGSEKPFSPATKQEILDAFDKSVKETRSALEKMSDADFGKIWTFTYKGQQVMAMPRLAVFRGMVMNHLIHHRAQLGVYLRMNNVAVPGMYGPSADDKGAFGAAGA